ncbi:hypothetical protein MNV49_001788 [Pseudohyphozyma bogoriensis]|nr:hypothetical protein MNV49_001788 [Pseudohyphozyma bogoriensis]
MMNDATEGSTRTTQRAPASCTYCYRRKKKCSKDPLPCDRCVAKGIADRCHREEVKIVTRKQLRPPTPEKRILSSQDYESIISALSKQIIDKDRLLADQEDIIHAQQRLMKNHGLSLSASRPPADDSSPVPADDDLVRESEYAVLGLPTELATRTTGAYFADRSALEQVGFKPGKLDALLAAYFADTSPLEEAETLPRLWFDASIEALDRSHVLACPTLNALQAICILPMLANTFGASAYMSSLLHLGLKMAIGFQFHLLGPDSKISPKLDAVHCEVGRRIWLCLITAERLDPSARQRYSLLYPPARTSEPSNVNDTDISAAEPPRPARPLSEVTDVSYLLAVGRMTTVARQFVLDMSAARTIAEMCHVSEKTDAELVAISNFCPKLNIFDTFPQERPRLAFDYQPHPPTFDYLPWARYQLAVCVMKQRIHSLRWCVGKRSDKALLPRRKGWQARPPPGFGRRTLFVGNLSSSTSSHALGELVEKIGPVVRVDIPVEPFLGYGFVQLERAEDAEVACGNLDGMMVDNLRLKVRWAHHDKQNLPRDMRMTIRGGGAKLEFEAQESPSRAQVEVRVAKQGQEQESLSSRAPAQEE